MASRKKQREKKRRRAATTPPESRATEAITVAWTVSLTTVLMCDLVAIGVHVYVMANPDARRLQMLGHMLLLAGAVIGALSIVLLPIVFRVRRVPPPTALAAFGLCVAVAPIVAVVARMVRG